VLSNCAGYVHEPYLAGVLNAVTSGEAPGPTATQHTAQVALLAPCLFCAGAPPMASSSTSNTNVAFGGITPAIPPGPYA